MRIGHGYDVHRMKQGRRCVLCGVEVPHGSGPDGHSDADVPVHALMDAMLGAAALGDIGQHFPPSDNKWKDARSTELLRIIYSLIKSHGYKLGNADITIIAESPRLSAYIPQMRQMLAEVLETDVSAVSVKATTEEGLGFTGEKKGIAAHAVVVLVSN